MTDFFEEAGVAVEAKPENEQEGSNTLAVSLQDFSSLEERVLRAVEVVRQERNARVAAETRATQAEERATRAEELAAQAESRAAQAEAALHNQTPVMESLQTEVKGLRNERDHVRQRVERLLEQLEGLEL